MNKKNERTGSQELSKCIWMKSGLVEYKLCDKNYYCEDCLFDKVMRNCQFPEYSTKQRSTHNDPMRILNKITDNICTEKYNENYSYLCNSLVVKHMLTNTFYLGLSPLVYDLLDNTTEIIDGMSSNYASYGQPLLEIAGEWGSVSIKAPMNFFILEKFGASASDILKNKWIAVIGLDERNIDNICLTENQWERIRTGCLELLSIYNGSSPDIGETYYDGGKEIKYLYQIIGKSAYYTLLNKLFNNSTGE